MRTDKVKSEAEKLRELWEKEKAIEAGIIQEKKFSMTREEFNKLPVHKQQALYEEFPEEVTALIKSE